MEALHSIGVLGVGQMGAAYVQALVDSGFSVHGFDVSADRMEKLVERGGTPLESPAELAAECDIVISSLPTRSAFDSALFGINGLFSVQKQGLTVIETSTFPVEAKEDARNRARLLQAELLDCPVSGTAAQAERGDLAIFASGPADVVQSCAPIFEALGRTWSNVGEFGNGTRVKLVANLLIAVHNLAAGEALNLGRKAGLDPNMLYGVLCSSAATSRMLEVSGPLILSRAYANAGSKISILYKDVQIIQDFAAASEAVVPLLATTAQFYQAAMANGMADWEDCAVADLIAQLSGVQESINPERKIHD